MAGTPAAWYPDPTQAGQLRWWDGNAWTSHTHHAAAPAATVSASWDAAWYPDVTQPGMLRWWDGKAWTTHTTADTGTPAVSAPPASSTASPVIPERRGSHEAPAVSENRGSWFGRLKHAATEPRPSAANAAQPRPVAPRPKTFSAPKPIRPATPARPAADLFGGIWVPAGQYTSVHRHTIPGGMLYVGKKLPAANGNGPDPALINPNLPIDARNPDRFARTTDYWPSYSSITPQARAAYLAWLADGRRDPRAPVTWPFLFFYGLEHRLFVDKAVSESTTLRSPRSTDFLISMGTTVRSGGMQLAFLKRPIFAATQDDQRPRLAPDIRSGYEMPMPARTYLGRKLALKAPLDAEDALLWVLSMPDTNLRTPAVRCFDELLTLWPRRFVLCGIRMALESQCPEDRLRFGYRAASGGFTAKLDVTDASGPLPDIAAISAPLTGLRDLLANCTEELAPYSRLLGKNPDAKGTLEAAMLLPSDLYPHLRSGEWERRSACNQCSKERRWLALRSGNWPRLCRSI